MLNDIENRKVDKRESQEQKVKVLTALDLKVDAVEVQRIISNLQSDLTQKILEFRTDLLKKVQDLQSTFHALFFTGYA